MDKREINLFDTRLIKDSLLVVALLRSLKSEMRSDDIRGSLEPILPIAVFRRADSFAERSFDSWRTESLIVEFDRFLSQNSSKFDAGRLIGL